MPFILVLRSFLVFSVKMPFLLWSDVDSRWRVIFNALKKKIMTVLEIPDATRLGYSSGAQSGGAEFAFLLLIAFS